MEITFVPEWIRRLSMAALMLTHVQFAAFMIGIFGLSAAMEFFGLLNPRQPYLDRLARSLARTAAILYGTGAVIAIVFVLIISLLWPGFWYLIMRITFWPMVLEGITFVLTVLYLFPWYYTWDTLARFKGAHVSLGFALVFVAQAQQGFIDVMAGYMLTPTPENDVLRVFFNATAIPLDMHRIVGNVSFAGFVVAGYAAWRMLGTGDAEKRSYFDWVGNIGLMAGLGFLFLQPVIGLSYVEEIRANSPGAFTRMMRGSLSWLFLVQVAILSGLFFLSVRYMELQVRKSTVSKNRLLRISRIVVGLSALLLVQPYVIGPSQEHAWINWVNPIGSMQPWKYIALGFMALASIGAMFSYLGWLRWGIRWGQLAGGGRSAQYTLVALAILASAMMALMGYIRENARYPYLIYYKQRLDQPGRLPTLEPTPTAVAAPAPSTASPVPQEQGR